MMWSPWQLVYRTAIGCMVLEILIHNVAQGLNVCMSGSATSCEECLLIHPSCAWCAQEEFGRVRTLMSRCDLSQNLQKRGCEAYNIENPRSTTRVVKSEPLSSKGSGPTQYDVIQIMPQKISLSLRPSDQTSFKVQVRQVEDYPVDLYYLMDLSLSMKDDLDSIRNLGTKLADEMRKLTSNFRLGFGSFVDKNMSPFSYTAPKYQDNPCNGYKLFPNCVPSFGFRHLLSLTDKVDRFNEEVQKQMVSRNRDAPEGGFDAILQAAVCKERIGWRKEAFHLLVFATDDVPHLALDGKLGGLVQPHDGKCHMNEKNEYSGSTEMDYPSLALLGEKLAENNIYLIFAVTKRHYVIYKNFTTLIPGTTVEILDADSKNIIQLIVNAYNNIRSKVELTVWDQPEDLSLTFTATCQDGQPLPGLRKCADLKIGDTVSFNVSVEARGCPPPGTRQSFTVKPVGFKDRLEVSVDYRCDCGCTHRARANSSRCSSRGQYVCGTCRCDTGHLGARCECHEGEAGAVYQGACREAEGKQICSGRGECSCNQCLCYESEFGKIYGTFCECDDFSCARHKGVLCSGESRSTKSHTGESRSTKSHTGESRSTKSHTGESRSTKSRTGESRSTKSHTGESRSTKSNTGESRSTKSHTGESRSTKSHTGESRSAKSHTGESRSAKSHTGESRSAKSHTGESRSAKSHTGESRSAKSHTGESRSAKSNTGESRSAKSNTGESRSAKSKHRGVQIRQVKTQGSPDPPSQNTGESRSAKSKHRGVQIRQVKTQGSPDPPSQNTGESRSAKSKHRGVQIRQVKTQGSPDPPS
ncbi:integrin beta-5 isoform X1 [Esox lucius]|uniref:integrin beta-5 isoform X1 n=1 Tax=Esox lucius TaxID=8010 RepID=UPI001476927A|nr:integrin beta-5 isoform X1 [Esox lucius]